MKARHDDERLESQSQRREPLTVVSKLCEKERNFRDDQLSALGALKGSPSEETPGFMVVVVSTLTAVTFAGCWAKK